jgi:hypothetical protein
VTESLLRRDAEGSQLPESSHAKNETDNRNVHSLERRVVINIEYFHRFHLSLCRSLRGFQQRLTARKIYFPTDIKPVSIFIVLKSLRCFKYNGNFAHLLMISESYIEFLSFISKFSSKITAISGCINYISCARYLQSIKF